jgi:lipoate-protein ligase A
MIILFSTSNSPTFNLAAEDFLLSERQDDLLFLYVNEPSVIIGCNQAIRNEVDLDFCTENDIQVVRRMSGGGAVYHDLGNLNYCFISNKIDGKSAINDDFLQPIVEVLSTFGVSAEIGKRKDLWLPDGYKISGTASHVSKNRELHHGTLLYETNLEMLEKALSPNLKDERVKAISSVRSKVKNLKTYFEEQKQFTLISAVFFEFLINKLLQYFKLEIVNYLLENEVEKIQQLEESKYKLNNWTFKK